MRPSPSSTARRALYAEARHALARGWGFGGRVRLSCLRDRWNAVFRVEQAGERFLLRLHSDRYHEPAAITSELAWVAALARDTELAIGAPVASGDGELAPVIALPVLGARACTLLRWVEGRRIARMGPPSFARLGALAATLHEHAAHWRPAAGFVRPQIEIESLARYWFRPHDDRGWRGLDRFTRALYRAAIDVAVARERALRASHPHAFGLVHADLHGGNVLTTLRGLAPIDFDDCGYACHLFDLAVPLAAASRSSASAEGRALIAGYRSVRALDDALVDHLDALIAARAVGVALFVRGWALEDSRFAPKVERYTREAAAFVRSLRAGV